MMFSTRTPPLRRPRRPNRMAVRPQTKLRVDLKLLSCSMNFPLCSDASMQKCCRGRFLECYCWKTMSGEGGREGDRSRKVTLVSTPKAGTEAVGFAGEVASAEFDQTVCSLRRRA